ncbi:MAG TPA: DUF1178 family protein [Paracoccaceae bacterium]|nr:DUF1178 family protein [Paracoccaceae bacterium]
MIRYSLRCAAGHGFDSWFQSAAAYDRLAEGGRLACGVCGGAGVEKAPMAPAVGASAPAAPEPPADRPSTDHPLADRALSRPASGVEAALAALRRHVEETSDYVGLNFAAEARRMHAGDTPERAIHGEARIDEARKLIEDGVPVAPLPFLPARKVN